ncbi:MAG: glycosyltransferase family 2 protein [Blastocatellales bacterium]
MDASVIIPTYNRSDAILETLSALAQVDYPRDRWEAVVVDDGSTDGTEDAVGRWIATTKAPVRYFRQKNAGPAAARNHGAALARGEALIFIDNDIIVPSHFVRAHLETLKSNPGSWVLGRIAHPRELRKTPFGRYRDDAWESFHRSYPADSVSVTDGMSAANVSMPAADFQRLGGFDESFTIASSEDWDLGMRARQIGVSVFYNPGIVVLHNDWAVSLEKFCERQRLYSISDVLLWQKYGADSPRVSLIRQNAPVDWGNDSLRLVCKKLVKRSLATGAGKKLVTLACRIAERLAPDSRLNRRAYETAVGAAIFSGVREGLRRYGTEEGRRDG